MFYRAELQGERLWRSIRGMLSFRAFWRRAVGPPLFLWLLACAVALALHCGWAHMLARQAKHAGERATQTALTLAATRTAAEVAQWLGHAAATAWDTASKNAPPPTTGNSPTSGPPLLGMVSIAAGPPRSVRQRHGLDIPQALWFFPPPGQSALSPPALLNLAHLDMARRNLPASAPPPAAGSGDAASVEALLLARTSPYGNTDGNTDIAALPLGPLLGMVAAQENACRRGAVLLPTHAGAYLLSSAPLPAAVAESLRRMLLPAQEHSTLSQAVARASFPPVAGAPLPIYAAFTSLCPPSAAGDALAGLPLPFLLAEGLATALFLILSALFFFRSRPASSPANALADAQDRLRAEEARRRQLSGQLISLLENMRHTLARELHDHTGQRLTTLLLALESPHRPVDAAGLQSLTDSAARELRAVQQEIRFLARGLRPPALETLGLEAALRGLCDQYVAPAPSAQTGPPGPASPFGEKTPDVRFFAAHVPPPTALDHDRALALYRVAQEALNNAVKYAQASSIHVSLVGRGALLALTVEDDGKGFAPPSPDAASPPADSSTREDAAPTGLGLSLMAERMAQWGGTLHVDSAPGRGTVVMAELPLR